eukprot:m.426963 g.426963  ORF g.426963 m.426963 type:complete len:238 (-) comp21361_c0_seq3:402-1115(-)
MDRSSIELPGAQDTLVDAIAAAVGPSTPVVSVLIHGASMDIGNVLNKSDAVLDAFYPGMFGAQALAETLFGENTPGGKLPYTYYRKTYVDRIPMTEFSMATAPGRGYRYINPTDQDILLPFGHGLSYTEFNVSCTSTPGLVLDNRGADGNASVDVAFSVQNVGEVQGGETVLAYWRPLNRTNPGGAQLLPLQLHAFPGPTLHVARRSRHTEEALRLCQSCNDATVAINNGYGVVICG